MKIYVEVVIFLFLLLLFLSWKLWERSSRKRLLKKYSVDDDKSKNGELKQRAIREAEQRTASGNKSRTSVKSANPVRPPKPTGRSVLPKTKPSSSRKNRSSIRNLLKRRRK